MGVPSTTFGHNQIVPAANVIDAGTFGAADAGAAVYLAAFAQQGAGFGVHLLHQHAFEAVDHIDQVALTCSSEGSNPMLFKYTGWLHGPVMEAARLI